ncbi:Serine/threonine-protein kinase AFC2 [Tetrabaena socialis]|uniref:Serine/threonine-protein kinase AFC2 n=1 Tax=Tetrabaena socialis TaxID=47790 RepID=A0A2J7ZU91_9CHLO|nr:Serine/threonine-protein kinase AFC2 [Tetrabaena socialis]|eukprot:PNH03834.1 Serine/threonine-protein kinase AFC2 [Tetrabaena socialis]
MTTVVLGPPLYPPLYQSIRESNSRPAATLFTMPADTELPSCSRPQATKRGFLSSSGSSEVTSLVPVRKRARLEVHRPGVPTQISLTAFAGRVSPPVREDDKDGHFQYELGENLSSRYKILSKMGEGTFGRVLECWDRKREDYVAIKIVRNIDKYRHAAMIELEVLNTLEKNDPSGINHCVALREWFEYRGHVCMVFEKLGLSLFDYMRKNSYKPFPLDVVQEFGRQLLEAVSYMHELRLVHTDLKPENILLTCHESAQPAESCGSSGSARCCSRPPSAEIKVIDFGSATFEEQYHRCGDPSARSYAGELVDLIASMLRYDAADRLTAQQALAHPFFAASACAPLPMAMPLLPMAAAGPLMGPVMLGSGGGTVVTLTALAAAAAAAAGVADGTTNAGLLQAAQVRAAA